MYGIQGAASWEASTHTIRLYLRDKLVAKTRVSLTFVVINPVVGGSAANVSIESVETGILPLLVKGDE